MSKHFILLLTITLAAGMYLVQNQTYVTITCDNFVVSFATITMILMEVVNQLLSIFKMTWNIFIY